VVLGEGEPGILRLILEAQGFHVVGHARDDEELRRVVGVTRPTVIVLDAGISALALLDTQIRSDYVPIVVVWPKGTYTPAAEERVEPTTAFLELGNAVRRVVERHAEPIRLPEAEDELDDHDEDSPVGRRRGGRARHALVLAAAWTIALTALAAIGLAVPSAFRSLEPAGTSRALRGRPELAFTADREGRGGQATEVDAGTGCARPERVRVGPRSGRGGGHGCALGHEKHGSPGSRGNGNGRPDDPGKGSGRGGANAGGPSNEPQGPGEEKDEEKSGGRATDVPRGSGGGGGSDDGSDPPSQDHNSGSGGGKAGRSGGDERGSPGQGKGWDKN
jgi:hypothetical protein